MAKHLLNKGFTLIEFLIVIVVISIFNILVLQNDNQKTYKNLLEISNLSNNLVKSQIESIKFKEKNCLEESRVLSVHPICFNENGNINISQTISLVNNNFTITVFLGAGSHEIK